MASFKGVDYYTVGTIEIAFPEDDVRCALCPVLQTYSRNQCMKTGEFIGDTRGIGYRCPMRGTFYKFPAKEDKDGTEQES